MNKYKITNLTTGARHYLNEEEKQTFFLQNCYQSRTGAVMYDIINLTEQKRIRRSKILDNIAFVCFFAATILSTILIIETYY